MAKFECGSQSSGLLVKIITGLMYGLGSILNLICIIIFIKIIKVEQRHNGNMFKYLALKSFNDLIFLSLIIPVLYYIKSNGTSDHAYILQLYFKWIISYITMIAKTASAWFEVSASFDCLLLISNQLQILKMIKLKWVSIVIYTFCFAFYLSYALQFSIIEIKLNSTQIRLYDTKLIPTSYYKYYNIIQALVRDVIPVVLMVVANILILVFIRNTTKRRRELTKYSNRVSTMVTNSQIAEKNKIKMIFFTTLAYMLHIPSIIVSVLNISYNCFYIIASLALTFSYCVGFFIYIFTNTKFRKLFFNLFRFRNE
jgi:hypothetical protein